MFRLMKFPLEVSLFLIAMLLLASCSAENPPPAPVEGETAEESDVVTTTEPATENQVPTTLSEVPRITVEELKERLDDGEAIVVADTRSPSSFDASHIAGAISIPVTEVTTHLDELPRDQEIVLYCT